MTEIERLQVAINVIANQRNAALNEVAGLQAELAAVRQELEQAKKPQDE